jgi:hypothetical protein
MPTYDDSSQYLGRLEQLIRRASVNQPSETRAPEPVAAVASAPPPMMAPQATYQPPPPTFNPDFEWLNAPTDLQETGLTSTLVEDHLIRTVYFANELVAAELAQECGLPYMVLDPMLKALTKDLYLDVKGQRGVGDMGYIYCLSGKGKARAAECLQRSWYRGTLPVPLDRYVAAIRAQTVRNVVVTSDSIRGAFADLIIKEKILDQLGPAVNSGSSLFLFGAPGNGKTAIAERLTRCMGDAIYIPRAIEVDGYVIKLFDALSHRELDEVADRTRDPRWVKIKRPVVTVGGELTMAGLDLLWNDVGRYYEAPLQMKANGGIFFIDDFGRQIVRPEELLNRWIVPLEKRVDYLTLLTGKKIEVPFDELLVFSTNLNPEDLADEAFLRRIKFKVNAEDPDLPQFAQILQLVCRQRGVPYDEAGLRYMLETWWMPNNRSLRMCHPRDIVDQLIAIASYSRREPRLVPDLLDRACRSYFID